MTKEELKEFITKNLIASNGYLSSTKLRKLDKDIILDITKETSYLKDVKISQRIYDITNNISDSNKCICGELLLFNNNQQGYKTSCGSSSCTSIISAPKNLVTKKINNIKNISYSTNISDISTLSLKEWITSNLITTKGINGAKLQPGSVFYNYNKEIFNKIDHLTSYLETKATYAERIYSIMNDLNSIPLCKECNKNTVKFYNYIKGYKSFCSNRCGINKDTLNKTKKTKLDRYGDENFCNPDKAKETFILNYGVDNPNKCQYIVDKIVSTKLSKSDEEKEKTLKLRQITSLKKYGVDNIRKSRKFIESNINNPVRKAKQILVQKTNYYNRVISDSYVDSYHLELLTTFEEYFNKDEIKFKCKQCNTEYIKYDLISDGTIHWCGSCFPKTSLPTQYSIFEFIKQYIGNVIYEDRSLLKEPGSRFSKEIDILVPNSFGIEFDGLMWHSYGKNKHSKFDNHKEETTTKHLEKTELVESKNIQLFHVFENEWKYKQDIWKSIILNKLGFNEVIYARKCEVREISNTESSVFLNDNHLQGNINSSIKIGLYYSNELVAVMTFGKSRYNKDVEYELLRFCNKINISIVGGASKLLTYFERNYNPKSIISYANRRWSQGNLYDKLGFDFKYNTLPNYFYFKNGKPEVLESRIKYQKHKLKNILDTFDSSLTESENMYNNDFRKIYDCGNKVYLKVY